MATKLEPPASPKTGKKDWTIVIIVLGVMLIASALVVAYSQSIFDSATGANDNTGTQTPSGTYARFDYSVSHKASLTESNGYEVKPGAGKEFVVATVKVVNRASVSFDTNSFYWDYTVNSLTYTSSSYTYFDNLVDYSSVTINPGGSATFQIIYEVPSGLGDGVVSYDGPYDRLMVRDITLL